MRLSGLNLLYCGSCSLQHLLGASLSPRQGAKTSMRALDVRLTFSSPAAYSLLSKRFRSRDDRRPPEGLVTCAISSSSTHSTLTGASCIAGRTSSPLRHWYLI